MTNGKCVFCLLQGKQSQPEQGIDVTIASVEKEIGQLNDYLMLLNTYKALGAKVVPQRPNIKSPRQQAIAEGKRWYTPLKPCKHCHTLSERYVANGICRNCHK